MDRGRFVRQAHYYYALAVANYLRSRSPTTHARMTNDLSEYSSHKYLRKKLIFDKAASWLSEEGLIYIVDDDFAPSLFHKSGDFDERWNALVEDEELPFSKFVSADEDRTWLLQALYNVDYHFDELSIEEEDFEELDREWAPLPIDRENPDVKKIVEELESTIDQVRSDNGYAAKLPEERDYVLESLARSNEKFKSDSGISFEYLKKNAIEPLAVLIRRFKDAAIGISAIAARDAIITWLKQHGIKFLTNMFG